MGNRPKLIYNAGHFAHYYGMPDESIYIIYSVPYKTPTGRPGSKFVIARLKEFSYDYKNEILFELKNDEKTQTLNYIVVDRCNQRIEIIKTSKKVRTFVETVPGKASTFDHSTPDKIDHPWPELNACYLNIYDNCTLTGQMWSALPAFPVIILIIAFLFLKSIH